MELMEKKEDILKSDLKKLIGMAKIKDTRNARKSLSMDGESSGKADTGAESKKSGMEGDRIKAKP